MESFTGQIMPIAFNYAPRYTAFCQGQSLPVNQNQALFSLLGIAFGGDGQTSFNLPNTGGRTITGGVGAGAVLGVVGGEANHALSLAEMPAHAHALNAVTGGTPLPGALGSMPGTSSTPAYAAADAPYIGLAADPLGQAGGGQPHLNMQPSAAINFVIVLAGYYPTRS